MIRCKTVICNKLGLHTRAASAFVKRSIKFSAKINVIYLDKTSDGKSIMSLILLEAGYGAEIEICAEGYDEKVAVHKLVEFVEQKFGELE